MHTRYFWQANENDTEGFLSDDVLAKLEELLYVPTVKRYVCTLLPPSGVTKAPLDTVAVGMPSQRSSM